MNLLKNIYLILETSPHVIFNQHLFDIIEVLEKNNLSVVPVLDEDK